MSARLVTGRLFSLVRQLQPWHIPARITAVASSRGFSFSVTKYGSYLCMHSGPQHYGSLMENARRFTQSAQPERRTETQDADNGPSIGQDLPMEATQKPVNKVKDEVIRQKKVLQRALARFKSRLALFKISARYRTKRKIENNLSAIKRYMNEKRLKFGAIAINPQRLQKMREIRGKLAHKSTAFRIGVSYLLRRFGKLGAGIYFGVYIVTLIFMNMLTFNGYVTSDDLRLMLQKVHLDHFNLPDIDTPFARFSVAYIATKALEPARFVVSLLLIMIANKVLKR